MSKFISLGLIVTLMGLTGCNTIRGIGQDIEKAGAAIEKSAK